MFYYFMFHYYVLPIFIAHVVGIVIKTVFINQDVWLYLESTCRRCNWIVTQLAWLQWLEPCC